MTSLVQKQGDEIAVVGMGCRFPGADGVEEFWHLMTRNADAVGEVPADRFDIDAVYHPAPAPPGRTASRHGGFLSEAFAFDALFFGISHAEARDMDPQQRLLLHVVWEAFEDAGIRPSALAGSRTGVFVGQATAEYGEVGAEHAVRDIRSAAGSRLRATTAGRVSYAFDLRGPSLVLDTACSSSLVAVHTARQSLLAGESDLAVAGGVSFILSPADAIAYSQAGMLAPDGRCKFADASADGFVRSEGVGAVVLKRLSDARRDGDPVLAVLRGSAVVNDGRGSGLLLQPAVAGQVQTARTAWQAAGIDPADLRYVEAHGTGTVAGDGVELRALTEAVTGHRRPGDPLLIGSVKTNIGHAEAAAGIAGLIKAVLIARHGLIPASLHVTAPHEILAADDAPLEVVTANRPLATTAGPALLGVSSFGISGTNAHVVVGAYGDEGSDGDGVRGAARDAVGDARVAGTATGGATGLAAAPATGSAIGSATGPAAGPATGVATSTVTGPATGPAAGPATGVATSTVTGPATGPAAGPTTGGATEAATGPALGPTTGGATDPAAGPALAPFGAGAADPQLLVLSARSHASLLALARSYAAHLGPTGPGRDVPLRDLCAAAALRRDAHPYRLWAVAATHGELAAALTALADGREVPGAGVAEAGFSPRRTVFVFPGQGSQWPRMGHGLLAASPAFAAAMTACDEAVRAELGWSPAALLERDELPTDIDVVQPLLWSMEVALAATWQAMGVAPDLCIGHSMGEAAAAQAVGALSLTDAAAVICRRSRLMKRLAGQGAMLAVELSADEARETAAAYGDAVCVAAENAPLGTVLAGDAEALRRIGDELATRDVFCRPVRVDVASHSPAMDALRDELPAALRSLAPTRTHTAMTSTTRCAPVTGPDLDPAYWMDNLRQPVRFVDTVRGVLKADAPVFVEISPHPLLVGAVEETQREAGAAGAAVPSLRRGQDERTALTQALGQVYGHGGEVVWERWFGAPAAHVPLPRYSWDAQAFRLPLPQAPAALTGRRTPFVRETPLTAWGSREWGSAVSVHGLTPVPPVVYLAAALDAGRELTGTADLELVDARLGDTYVDAGEADGLSLRTTVAAAAGAGEWEVLVEALGAGTSAVCLQARLRPAAADTQEDGAGEGEGAAGSARVDAALERCTRFHRAAAFRELAAERGYTIDPRFDGVGRLWTGAGEAVARMATPEVPYPASLESVFQPLIAALPPELRLPVSFDRVRLSGRLDGEFWSIARRTAAADRADVDVVGADGRGIAAFEGIRLRAAGSPGSGSAGSASAGSRAGTSAATPAVTPRVSPPPASRPLPLSTPAALTAEAFAAHAAVVLGMPAELLDPRRPLRDFGLDSLMATRLRRRVREDHGVDIEVDRLLGGASVAEVLRDPAG
ncbi:type I polyketide synthase [Streptomyces sp. ISL-86]|uniref:type I polyketide synthase n=1 Tax=Streptomyces sp. ISL-86 TaxID=2819187 RepID=UPI001BEC1C51|nr:type I polyketide synthase [Streptomyces sp. ISL-86]MBT2459023.1 acyltransferase domain-containing protein [Streptomyces sp. ISL-86]